MSTLCVCPPVAVILLNSPPPAGEDGEELSSAGQNATVLGCRGREQLRSGLTQCWASLFAPHSVQYRRQHGQHVHPGMAVVVQEMVPAEVSGVMFTRDPVTGDPAQISISASYGLGEVSAGLAYESVLLVVMLLLLESIGSTRMAQFCIPFKSLLSALLACTTLPALFLHSGLGNIAFIVTSSVTDFS